MDKFSGSVADAELKLLQALWDRPGLTARELTELTYGEVSASQIATVQKLLQRLEAKGLVRRDRSEHVHTFGAEITRDAYAGGQLERMAQKLTEGSLVPFLTHMVEARKISKQERDQIRALLEDDTPKKKPRGRK